MNPKCSICFDALGPDNSPVATRCGHLYCLECATFNFGRPDAACAICRAPHTLKKLVKLYPDYEQESQVSGPRLATAGPGNASAPLMQGTDMDTWDESTLVDIALDRCVYALPSSWDPTYAAPGRTLPYPGAASVARRVQICGCVSYAVLGERC